MSNRGQAYLTRFFPRHHWQRIPVVLRITSVRHVEADAQERGPHSSVHRVSCPEHIGLIGLGIGYGRSGVLWSSNSLPQHGLTLTLREHQSGKRVPKTPSHARIATGPQNTTDHVSGSAKPTSMWSTISAILRFSGPSNDWTARPLPRESHSYSRKIS